MVAHSKSLWSLVDQQYVAADDLAHAIEEQALSGDLDFRTRLLIRDGMTALQGFWGPRWHAWYSTCPARERIESICREDLGRPGFPFLKKQLMEPTRPETVRQFFRDLGMRVHEPVRLNVGGSIALIMPGLLSRKTQDVDVVDEVPQAIRNQHQLLHDLQDRYRLELAHFQSHYLPMRWENHLHYFDEFGRIRVYLVDACDVFLGKLTSIREKDLDDLRVIAPQLNKETITERLKENMASALADAELRKRAQHNWYVLYGEALPA